MSMSRTLSLRVSPVVCATVLLATAAVAQTTNGTILGDITDPQQSAVVGATVTVKEIDTGVTRTVQTSPTGSYRVFPLLPGRYEVSASAAGFKKKVQSNVTLEIASTVKVDFQLDVGQITETVEVTASSAVLQTPDASVGGVVTSTE